MKTITLTPMQAGLLAQAINFAMDAIMDDHDGTDEEAEVDGDQLEALAGRLRDAGFAGETVMVGNREFTPQLILSTDIEYLTPIDPQRTLVPIDELFEGIEAKIDEDGSQA